MEYHFEIADIRFKILTPMSFEVEKELVPFKKSSYRVPDVVIQVVTEREHMPEPQEKKLGEDMLLAYYQQDDILLCVAKGSRGKKISVTVCNDSLASLTCFLNTDIFTKSSQTIGNLLRLLPMRMIFQEQQALFFHASQIAVKGKGILFAAASGVGKTTQAKLWERHQGAEIVCNDRTLVRFGKTYGYPIDGSEPVISGKVYPLGAVVILMQAKENEIRRLKSSEALVKLMPQVVFDTWSFSQRTLAMEHLMHLFAETPIYLLRCSPDARAVCCLEKQLKEDGVLQ